MSHVDEGELVAYADGAYPAEHPDAQRIAAHLTECGDCRTRLAQQETLRGRAAAILAYAAPASVRAPAFETLQQETRQARPRRTIPLAWAATIVLAAGLGWFGRGMWQYQPRGAETASMEAAAPAPAPAELQTQTPTQMPPQPVAPAVQQADARVGSGQSAAANGAPGPTDARRQTQRTELAEAAVEEVEAEGRVVTGSVAASDMARRTQTAAPPAAPPPAPVVANAERPLVAREVQLAHPAITGLPVKSVVTERDTTIVEQTLPDGKTIRLTIMAAAVTEMREAAKSRAANDVASQSAAAAAAPAYVTITLGGRIIRVQGAVSNDSLRALARQIR